MTWWQLASAPQRPSGRAVVALLAAAFVTFILAERRAP